MNPARIQNLLAGNAKDIEEFCSDLKGWGDDMKRKEDSLKKQNDIAKKVKVELNQTQTAYKSARKRGSTDYAKWDKFDADLECERVEEDIKTDSELTDEIEESVRDEALLNKEKGNTFVKSKEWNKAIKCYTDAIKCYSYDPIFYANRALCYLKIGKYTAAEEDCTLSLKLDSTYVKALQRRAAARENLGKLELALNDLEKVLCHEPKNKESISALANIKSKLPPVHTNTDERRPVSKFTASRNKVHNSVLTNQSLSKIDTSMPGSSSWPAPGCDITLVKTINKPPHLRSNAPLKRIEITEVGNVSIIEEDDKEVAVKKHVIENIEKKQTDENSSTKPDSAFKKKREQLQNVKNEKLSDLAWPRPDNKNSNLIRSDDLKIIENKFDESSTKDLKNTENLGKTKIDNKEMNDIINKFSVPSNSVQFYSTWKNLGAGEDKFKYLKCIRAEKIPNIFQESLESNVFSSILDVLSTHFIKNNEEVYNYLENLTKVKRFSALTMFMDSTDKNCLWKLISYLRKQGSVSTNEIDNLVSKYEL